MKAILLWGGVGILLVAGIFVVVSFAGTPAPSGGGEGIPLSPAVTERDHIKGNSDAPAVFVEYGDFQCPACAQYEPILERIAEEFGEDVAIVWRHFPLRQVHENAESSARASEAAARQGKFWEMHKLLFEQQSEWAKTSNPEEVFAEYAVSLGMNREQFVQDFRSEEVSTRIQEDFESALAQQLNSTPSFFFQGVRIANPQSYQQFRELITTAIEQHGDSTESTE